MSLPNIGSYDRQADASLILADGAAASTATGYSLVAAATATIDLGAAERCQFDLVVDVSAIDVATGDENYLFRLVGSNDATPFGTNIVPLTGMLELGDHSTLGPAIPATVSDRGVGRYVIPCENVGMVSGVRTAFRYIRLHRTNVGATSNSVTYKAFLSKRG